MSTKQPQDKSHFILPDLGEGVHEAEIIRWRVKPGERVQEHQTLAEMETDKALVEVPSPWSGVVRELHGGVGDIVKVGSVLVSYEVGGAPAGAHVAHAAVSEDAGTVVGSVDTKLAVSQRFTRRGPEAPAAAPGKSLATPAVRRVAKELGVDINQVRGTGRGGRVTASDIQAHSGEAASPAAAPAPRPQPAAAPGEGATRRIPFRGVRRRIAESLRHSISTAAHFTVTEEADVTDLDRKRREYGTVLGRKLSFLPMVITAACRALRQHPALNAVVDEEGQEILVQGEINLGIAVDTDHGLMVPVVRHADRLSIGDLAVAVADLAERARKRTIPREELVGGTFTISNVGSYGGLFATPIINHPEVAILAVGRVREQVLARKGMFYAGMVMPLSLSCDHRVVDGAEGARFLGTLARLLEQPQAIVQ
jgi:pyruvate dehydrogenase E2 component (dihydrolipoamide acetyltransferase)